MRKIALLLAALLLSVTAFGAADEVTYDGGYYIWQYSFTGKVSGVTDIDNTERTVDLNYSYKDWPTIFKKYGLNNM